MATKKTNPKEWEQFLVMCEKQDFDNPLFEHYRDLFFAGAKVKPIESMRRLKPVKVTKPDGTTEIHLGRDKLAEKLQINKNYISVQNGKLIQKGKLKGWRFDVLPKPIPIYALYEADELIGMGTLDELSEEHGITVSTLEFYYYQYHRPDTNKRVVLIDWELEGEE